MEDQIYGPHLGDTPLEQDEWTQWGPPWDPKWVIPPGLDP